MTRQTTRFVYALPLALILLAGFAMAVTMNVSRPDRAYATPIDLHPGVVVTGDFHTAYDGPHEIGLEMDQQAAKALFPCTVDVDTPEKRPCEKKFPVDISLTLFENGVDISKRITLDNLSTAGGRYTGDTGYIYGLAFVDLTKGKSYRLIARPRLDGSALKSANPKLVVDVDGIAVEGYELSLFLIEGIEALAILIGLVWVGVIYVLRRIRFARAKS